MYTAFRYELQILPQDFLCQDFLCQDFLCQKLRCRVMLPLPYKKSTRLKCKETNKYLSVALKKW